MKNVGIFLSVFMLIIDFQGEEGLPGEQGPTGPMGSPVS